MEVQRGSDVGFSSCAAPTYYLGPSISDNRIWNLGSYSEIERSLNRVERRVQIKAKFLETRNSVGRLWKLWSDVLRVTKGRVDNENNSQSRYSNMSNTYMNESLIY